MQKQELAALGLVFSLSFYKYVCKTLFRKSEPGNFFSLGFLILYSQGIIEEAGSLCFSEPISKVGKDKVGRGTLVANPKSLKKYFPHHVTANVLRSKRHCIPDGVKRRQGLKRVPGENQTCN